MSKVKAAPVWEMSFSQACSTDCPSPLQCCSEDNKNCIQATIKTPLYVPAWIRAFESTSKRLNLDSLCLVVSHLHQIGLLLLRRLIVDEFS